MKKKRKPICLLNTIIIVNLIGILTITLILFLNNSKATNEMQTRTSPSSTPLLEEVHTQPESTQIKTTTAPTLSPVPTITEESEDVFSSETIKSLPATTIINIENWDVSEMKTYFSKIKISDELYKRIYKKSYKEDCTVSLEDLRYLRVLHYGFDNKSHIGELIVNTSIADTVLSIFEELYDAKYPIEKMALIDNYDADDEASMEDNNTSCFNYRVIDGTNTLSKHSLGIAIDINPLYNPYVRPDKKERGVLPVNGAIYADRTLACPYYIQTNDICYKTFIKYGFTWGGNWSSSKDYQHFQTSQIKKN